MPEAPPNNPGRGAGSGPGTGAGNGAGNGSKPAGTSSSGAPKSIAAPAPATVKCPKCGADAREVARFCPRCHMTLRYTCPSCAHEQRHGESCDKCGVDFAKYLSAVVSAEKAKADVIHDRYQKRSNFLVNLLLIPVTGGLHLIKYLRPASRNKNS